MSDLRRLSAELSPTFLILQPRRTKKKDIYVISTAKRPVPLEHYLYAGKELWKIVDASGSFLGQGYKFSSLPPASRVDAQRFFSVVRISQV